MTPLEIGRALRLGMPVDDAEIDAHLPPELRAVSRRFWTPVAIAATAARWIAEQGASRVLDVGCGPGKVCVTAALATDLHTTGVEQRAPLVRAAASLARVFGVERRIELVEGTIEEVDLTAFDALYLFNPFGENLFGRTERLDDSVELGTDRMFRDLAIVEAALESFPIGRVVVTYHGFGGQVPDTFEPIREEPMGTDVLRLWVKERDTPRGARWFELGEEVVLVRDVSDRPPA